MTEEFMKKTKFEYVMKMILKESEDGDGCKGGGYVREISNLMNNFEDQY
jgi:hypothetical protein